MPKQLLKYILFLPSWHIFSRCVTSSSFLSVFQGTEAGTGGLIPYEGVPDLQQNTLQFHFSSDCHSQETHAQLSARLLHHAGAEGGRNEPLWRWSTTERLGTPGPSNRTAHRPQATYTLAVSPKSPVSRKVGDIKAVASQENRVNLLAPNKGHFQEILPSPSLRAHFQGTGRSTRWTLPCHGFSWTSYLPSSKCCKKLKKGITARNTGI